MKRIPIVLLAALLASAWAHAEQEDSKNAFYKGVVAYREFKFDEAAQYFNQAAEAGDVEAQFLLGRMHYDGNSLSVDRVTAWMWFDISAQNGLRAGERYRDGLAKRMSEEEVALAKRRADEWRQAHPATPYY